VDDQITSPSVFTSRTDAEASCRRSRIWLVSRSEMDATRLSFGLELLGIELGQPLILMRSFLDFRDRCNRSARAKELQPA